MTTEATGYLKQVLEYHEQTKHHLDKYARSLGYLDWASQPNPFRQYPGSPTIELDHPLVEDSPSYDEIFLPGSIVASEFNKKSVSQLFYDSLAISAWKQSPGSKPWALRVNPSSGNLHPTEAYLLCGPLPGISREAGIYHYSPLRHLLEKRVILTREEWADLTANCSHKVVFVVLTSIYWREAWKYGERAFRYCNHDAGHALGAVSLAAAAQGWNSRLIDTLSDNQLSILLSLEDQDQSEAEHPDCLLAIFDGTRNPALSIPSRVLERLSSGEYFGRANRLSSHHQPWPIIDRVSAATRHPGISYKEQHSPRPTADRPHAFSSFSGSARLLFRRRRSAVAMDTSVNMTRTSFLAAVHRLSAPGSVPFDLLSTSPMVSLPLFVHRVSDMKPGLYLLVRNPAHLSCLKGKMRSDFLWQKPDYCPEALPLYLLAEEDCRNTAKIVSCHQSIAADGAFSLSMLARFEPALWQFGPHFYRRLHWECGLIGQVLYLEAEAAGVNGTGIGCFHDDILHQFLGLEDRTWQTLYHFTVGKTLEDFRLQTIPAYNHLASTNSIERGSPGKA